MGRVFCTNQQPPPRGGAVPDPVWAKSKWLLAIPRVPVTPGTPHSHFFADYVVKHVACVVHGEIKDNH